MARHGLPANARHLQVGVLCARSDAIEAAKEDCVYNFQSDSVLNAVYGEIEAKDQQLQHKKCAAWIEDAYQADLRPYLLPLIRHYLTGGVRPNALKYAILAIKMALVAGAVTEARTFVNRAISICQNNYDERSPETDDDPSADEDLKENLAERLQFMVEAMDKEADCSNHAEQS